LNICSCCLGILMIFLVFSFIGIIVSWNKIITGYLKSYIKKINLYFWFYSIFIQCSMDLFYFDRCLLSICSTWTLYYFWQREHLCRNALFYFYLGFCSWYLNCQLMKNQNQHFLILYRLLLKFQLKSQLLLL
jgi:hypothetical protein